MKGGLQKTKLTNDTSTTISVKLNNSGILLKVKDVEKGGSYTISIDPNATFREYWCAQAPGNNTEKKAILTSDDCALWREISITRDESEFSWKGTKSRSRDVKAKSTEEAPAPSSTPGAPASSSTPGAPKPSSTPSAPKPSSTPGAPKPSSTPGAPKPSSKSNCRIM